MSASAADARPASRMFVVHGFERDADVTTVERGLNPQSALLASELSAAWIHDDTITSCPRCATALDLAVTG